MSDGDTLLSISALSSRVAPVWLLVAAALVAAITIGAFFASSALFAGDELPEAGASEPPDRASFPTSSLGPKGVLDSDRDGLSDAQENYVYGTDPEKWNSSGSEVPDGWLADHGYDPRVPGVGSKPAAKPPLTALPDTYENGWPNRFVPTLEEVYTFGRPDNWSEPTDGVYDNGLDPQEWDSNDDGIPDGWMIHYRLDPLDDSILSERLAGEQGLTVQKAFEHNTDPRKLDSDGDGILDAEEIEGPLDPTGSGDARFAPTDPTMYSTSGSGVCDGYMRAFGLDPSRSELALGDLDRDGATTVDEFNWSRDRFGEDACTEGEGVDPTKQSTAGLPIPDGWLIEYDLDPLDGSMADRVTQRAQADPGPDVDVPDGKTLPEVDLTVLDEYRFGRPADWNETTDGPWLGGTDPTSDDTDGDGLGDAWEQRGYYIRTSTDPVEATASSVLTESDPTRVDSDDDGLADPLEVTGAGDAGAPTDALRRDTDFDGIPDGEEVGLGLGLDPTRADSAGDLLRDGDRLELLRSRAERYSDDLQYEYPGEPGTVREVTDWAKELTGAENLSQPLTNEEISGLFGPSGDVDDDGDPNVVDSDIDGDRVRNGPEAQPELYRFTSYGTGPLSDGRSATDPLNPDTDGDGLVEAWEVRHGVALTDQDGLTTDPARWDSDDDGTSDGKEDPDGDSIVWPSYSGTEEDPELVEKDYRHDNLKEQRYGTDPNQADTDEDGLGDGWEAFWGMIYPTLSTSSTSHDIGIIYPGHEQGLSVVSPPAEIQTPHPNVEDPDRVLDTQTYQRFVRETEEGGVPEWETGPDEAVVDDLPSFSAFLLEGTYSFTFQDAQRSDTNPYMAATSSSTDGDGMSDAWERFFGSVLPPNIDERTRTAQDCQLTGALDPLRPDATLDAEGDDLSNGEETRFGTNPLCEDSDLGGRSDGEEARFEGLLDPMDPTDQDVPETDEDSDGDGVTDFDEVIGFEVAGTTVRTSPDDPDTDSDGLLDGPNRPSDPDGWKVDDPRAQRFLDLGIAYEKVAEDRLVFLGEKDQDTHPQRFSETSSSVPTGWVVARTGSPQASGPDIEEAYQFARPDWWNATAHGPWWGGAFPGEDVDDLRSTEDLDKDGLSDVDGDDGHEDPMPRANQPNRLREIEWSHHESSEPPSSDPADPSLEAGTRRVLAQAYLSPRKIDHQGLARGSADAPDMDLPCIPDDLEITEDGESTSVLVKGKTARLQGRVLRDCPSGDGIPNITVEARLAEQVIGAGFTDDNGTFDLPVNITTEHSLEMPSEAVVFKGQTDGLANWSIDTSLIQPEEWDLEVRTYATPDSASYPSAPSPRLDSTERDIPVAVHSDTLVSVDVPGTVLSGEAFEAQVRVTDSGGAPLERDGTLAWNDEEIPFQTASDGAATVRLDVPSSLVGTHPLHAETNTGDDDEFVTPGEATVEVDVRRPAVLDLAPLPETIDAGDSLEVQGGVTALGQGVQTTVFVNLSQTGTHQAGIAAPSGPEGEFETELPLPTDLSRGEHTLVVEAAGDDTTTSVTRSATMTVRSSPQFIQVRDSNLTVGQPVEVSGTLVDRESRPLSDASVQLDIAGNTRELRTDAVGGFSDAFDLDLPIRPVRQILSYAGGTNYTSTDHTTFRAVKTPTNLSVSSATVLRGETAQVEGHLEDASGAPIQGAPVRFSWGDDTPVTAITDRDGIAVLGRPVAADEGLGPVSVRASYNGSRDGTMEASADRATWLVKTGAGFDLPRGRFTAGREIPDGRLLELGTERPLSSAPIELTRSTSTGPVSDQDTITTTDADGRFPLLGSVARTAEPFVADFQVRYPGNDSFRPVDDQTSLTIRSPVALSIDAPSAIVQGQEIVLTVRLSDAQGEPVQAGAVNVSLDGKQLGQSPVEDGLARIPIVVSSPDTVGTVELTVRYAGAPQYAPAERDVPARILRDSEMTLDVDGDPDRNVRIVESTVTADGTPVSDGQVVLVTSDGTSLVETTDEEGVARFALPASSSERDVLVRHGTTDDTGPAAARGTVPAGTSGAQVPAGRLDNLLLVPGILIAIVLVGIGYYLYRQQRHPLAPAVRRARGALAADGTANQRVMRVYRILEDAAIAQGVLDAAASTPRILESSLMPELPTEIHPSLDQLVTVFERARYGGMSVDASDVEQAEDSLDRILRQLTLESWIDHQRSNTSGEGVPR